MQTDIDVQRYTDALVKKLGRRAPAHAAVRAEMMLEAGELNLYETWKEIIQSVNDRLAAAPSQQANAKAVRLSSAVRPGSRPSGTH